MSYAISLPTLPYRGTIAASWGSPAEEELLDTISFDEWLRPNQAASHLLKVTGTTMRAEGIFPGDILIVEKGRSSKRGDIVLAQIAGQTKLLKIDQPILMKVLAVVTVVIRKYR